MNIEKVNIRLSEESDIREFIAQIIDGFEDFLMERGVTINNPEIQEAKWSAEDPDEISMIYGSDYFYLEDMIGDIMRYWSKREGT